MKMEILETDAYPEIVYECSKHRQPIRLAKDNIRSPSTAI